MTSVMTASSNILRVTAGGIRWATAFVPNAASEPLDLAATLQPDAPGRLFDAWVQFVNRLSDPTFLTVLRLALLLVLCTTLCGFTLQRFAPTLERGAVMAIQAGCCLLGLFISLAIPLSVLHYTPLSKTFVFSVAWFALIVLPYRLAYTLTPKQGRQITLAKVVYLVVFLLFFLGLMF